MTHSEYRKLICENKDMAQRKLFDNGAGSMLLLTNQFAISENSSNKQGAWEFIRTFFDEEFVRSVNTASSGNFDSVIYKIIKEETSAYFAGECTAEKCAQLIQNRVSIMLSEQS